MGTLKSYIINSHKNYQALPLVAKAHRQALELALSALGQLPLMSLRIPVLLPFLGLLVGWLVGWLAGLLVGWLAGWPPQLDGTAMLLATLAQGLRGFREAVAVVKLLEALHTNSRSIVPAAIMLRKPAVGRVLSSTLTAHRTQKQATPPLFASSVAE